MSMRQSPHLHLFRSDCDRPRPGESRRHRWPRDGFVRSRSGRAEVRAINKRPTRSLAARTNDAGQLHHSYLIPGTTMLSADSPL